MELVFIQEMALKRWADLFFLLFYGLEFCPAVNKPLRLKLTFCLVENYQRWKVPL